MQSNLLVAPRRSVISHRAFHCAHQPRNLSTPRNRFGRVETMFESVFIPLRCSRGHSPVHPANFDAEIVSEFFLQPAALKGKPRQSGALTVHMHEGDTPRTPTTLNLGSGSTN